MGESACTLSLVVGHYDLTTKNEEESKWKHRTTTGGLTARLGLSTCG
jgi:hypothetical protein